MDSFESFSDHQEKDSSDEDKENAPVSYKICSKLRPFSNNYFANYTRLFGDKLSLQNQIVK